MTLDATKWNGTDGELSACVIKSIINTSSARNDAHVSYNSASMWRIMDTGRLPAPGLTVWYL